MRNIASLLLFDCHFNKLEQGQTHNNIITSSLVFEHMTEICILFEKS